MLDLGTISGGIIATVAGGLILHRLIGKKPQDPPSFGKSVRIGDISVKNSPHSDIQIGDRYVGSTILVNGSDGKSSDHKRTPSPREIMDESRKRPPFERRTFFQTHKGLLVEWELQFSGVKDPLPLGRTPNLHPVYLYFRSENHFPILIHCRDVDLEKYPRFKILKEDALVRVRGRIAGVDSTSVDLDDAEFAFAD